MMAHAFDTLAYANVLKKAGMAEAQAEALAELQSKMVEENSTVHATKADVETAKNELKAEINTRSLALESTIIKWVVGISFAQAALIVSLIKFIH
jgi:hypothetical protein